MKLGEFVERKAPMNRLALLVLLDTLVIGLAGFLALYIRFDFKFQNMDMSFMKTELKSLPIHILVTLALFVLFKLYRSVWRFASTAEFLNIVGACTTSMIAESAYMDVLNLRMPVSYYLLKYVILLAAVTGIRFMYRFLRLVQELRSGTKADRKR